MCRQILRSLIAWLLLVQAANPTQADEPRLARFSFAEPHMGTQFQIILYAPDEAQAKKAADAAFRRIADLDAMMSDYKPESELMRLCKKAGGGPVEVSPELFFVLARGQEVSKLSDGAFDVTVGPLARIWRLARRSHQMPDPERVQDALKVVGYQNIRLDPARRTVQLLRPGMQLDLGGIAKGYSGDEAQKLLKKHGVTRALVAAGGDIVVSGAPPETAGWLVGIAPLESLDGKPNRFLILENRAASTSGDAEQFVEIDGKRYSHIVDPRTGMGLPGRLSVTIVAPEGISADSLTKTVSVLGTEKGMKLIDSLDRVACLVVRQTEKGQESIASRRFAEIPQKSR